MIKRIVDKSTGLFIRDDFAANDGEIALDVAPAQGFYWPKWDGKAWVEGRTQAEIDAIIAQAEQAEPTETELLQAKINLLELRLAKVEAVPIVKTALEPVVIEPILIK